MNSKTRILIGILIIGIVVISGLWICKDRAYPEPLKRTFPQGLIVASQNGLVNLVYNPSKQMYEKQAEVALSDIIKEVVVLDNYIFISLRNKVLRFDSRLEKSISKKFGKIGTLATDNKNIFVAAEGSFIVLTKDLEELDRVKLEFNGYTRPEKNAHDILIYKNTAYLLDNIMRPLFLFRVNIQDPKNIQITEKIKFHGINAHLDEQWLNPELNQWLIIQSYGHRGGYGQTVHIYSMDEGKEPLTTKKIFSSIVREEYYDITLDEGIVKIDKVKGNYVTDERINITLVKPQEVDLTIKIFSKWNNIIYTENIALNKNRTSYLVTGYNKERHNIPIKTVEVYSNGKLIHKGSFYKEKGFKIRGITNLPPVWAIIQDREENYYLTQVKSENNKVLFSNLLDLDDIDTYKKVIIKHKDNYLFVAPENRRLLKIIDIEQQPKVILSKDLSEFNVRAIIDILPY
jgi:hypothetical protein